MFIVISVYLSNRVLIHKHSRALRDNIDDWQKLLEECLGHEVPAIRLKAAEAHTSFFVEYYTDIDYDARSVIINRYLESLRSSNQTIRIGFAQAIGKLKDFIFDAFKLILNRLHVHL